MYSEADRDSMHVKLVSLQLTLDAQLTRFRPMKRIALDLLHLLRAMCVLYPEVDNLVNPS